MSPEYDPSGSILDLAARISASSAPDDQKFHAFVDAMMALPGLEKLDVLSARASEYVVSAGSSKRQEHEAGLLRSVEGIARTVAPEVVAVAKVGERNAVLITRYAACPGETLVHVRDTKRPFEAHAVMRFRADLHALAARGLMHPYAARGFSHWLMSSETGVLVLEHWGVLRKARPAESTEALEQIEEMLRSRAGHVE